METLYWINLSYACFGVVVKDNIIVKSAPIGSWAIGKSIRFFLNWVLKKNGEYKLCPCSQMD